MRIRPHLPLLLFIVIIGYFLYRVGVGVPRPHGQNTLPSAITANVPKSLAIGTNLAEVSYYSSEFPFLNIFKTSTGWFPQTPKTWNTGEQLDKDPNGWVKTLPGPKKYGRAQRAVGAGAPRPYAAALLNRVDGHYPGGKYVVLYEGEGTLEYSFDAHKLETESTPGRDVIQVNPTPAGILIKLTETDPRHTGNYLHNLQVIPQKYEKIAINKIFNPQFLEKTKPFKAIRFMDWMKTNNSTQKDWKRRPIPEQATWFETGVPVEIMVKLANELNVDPWFNMPHQATDEYIRNFAVYVRDHLKRELEVYVEYSNEVWNPQFEQYQWVDKHSDLDVYETYGKRVAEITRLWDEVFEPDNQRIIGIMGAQSANPYTAKQAMRYADDSIDGIAIAGYVGGNIGSQDNLPRLESWMLTDEGLTNLFAAIKYPSDWKVTQEWIKLSQEYRRPIFAYEGGQHLVGIGPVVNNQRVTEFLIQANRDPSMGEVYQKLLTQWAEYYGGLFMHFNDIALPSKYGSWGALEYLDQESSPKYNSLINYINQHSALH